MRYFKDQHEYEVYLLRREVRFDVNKAGLLLLVFFAAQQVFSRLVAWIISATGTGAVYAESTTMQLLVNGAVSPIIFFLIALIYCLIRRLSFARLFPFERLGGAMIVMLCVIGLTFSLMSNYAAELVTDVFSLFGVRNHGGELVENGAKPPIALYYLTVAVLPALVEEFAFRGVIMGSLRRHSDALALLTSSAAFALMHGNFVQIPFTFCCGLVFGYLAIRTNSLLPAILVHFLNNALSVTYDVLIAYGVVSPSVYSIVYAALIIALCVLSLFFLRRIIREKPGMLRFYDSDRGIPYRDKVKLTVSSPTMIAFAAIMLLYAAYMLIR